MEGESKTCKIQVNYDEESKKNKLIKFIPKKGVKEIVISADEIVDIIAKHIQGQGLSISLVDVDRNVIDMMYIVRNLQFVADRDYKKGEKVSADCGMPYPAVLAACEFEFNRCKEGKDRTFYSITPDGVREYASLIKENNKDFVKHIDNLLSNKI